jgi:hypothetical protein
MVSALYTKYGTIKKAALGYIVIFDSAHIILFSLSGSPLPFAVIMTSGAIFSGFVFPYLILKFRSGFIYTYTLQFLFYIVIAALLKIYPPPGYFF